MPAQFDVNAARQSGATDDQILEYLSKRSPNFDVQGALKQANKQQVIDYLAANSEPPASVLSQPPAKKWYESAWDTVRPAAAVAGNFIQGAAKSAAETVFHPRAGETVDQSFAMAKGLAPAPTYTRSAEEAQSLKPQGIAQGLGAAAEQGAEMMLTGGPMRKGAMSLASKLPWAGRAAKTANFFVRTGAEALNTGANAAVHDQSIPAGMAFGAAGNVIGEGLQAIAPQIADKALGIWNKDRSFGRNPGKAALEETKAFTAGGVAEQAQQKLDDLNLALKTTANGSSLPASQQSAVSIVDNAIMEAVDQNNAANYKKLLALREQLTTNFRTGQTLQAQSAAEILNLRRGVDDLVTSWNPTETSKTVQGVIKQVRHELGNVLHNTAPGTGAIDSRISSLIPVAKRSGEVANGPGLTGQIIEKMRRPTGALVGSAVGAGIGYEQGGTGGALKGAAIGMSPTLLTQPSVGMTLARGFSSPIANGSLIAFGKGLFLQAFRKADGNTGYRFVRESDVQP